MIIDCVSSHTGCHAIHTMIVYVISTPYCPDFSCVPTCIYIQKKNEMLYIKLPYNK